MTSFGKEFTSRLYTFFFVTILKEAANFGDFISVFVVIDVDGVLGGLMGCSWFGIFGFFGLSLVVVY